MGTVSDRIWAQVGTSDTATPSTKSESTRSSRMPMSSVEALKMPVDCRSLSSRPTPE